MFHHSETHRPLRDYDFHDSQGRVVKKTETETYGRQESSTTTTYTYGNNTIISKIQGDWNNGEIHTFTLSDGRITKDVEESRSRNSYTYNYTYDSNGYLKTQVFTDDSDYPNSGRIEFIWTDGNLTKISKVWDDGESYSMTISYSSIPWPKNWMHYWKGTNMDKILEPLGAWGKMPKNLPLKYVQVDDDGNTEELTIDYTIENGEITKIIFQGNMYDNTEIYTIEWR